MRITVFGASGKVGLKVVEEALRRGHDVTAFVRREPSRVNRFPVRRIVGDVHQESAVAAAVGQSDAIISTLGSWGTPTKDILTAGMRSLIPAMVSAGVSRIVSLTGADARATGDHNGVVNTMARPLLSTLAGPILRDGESHIALLERSGLNWTVIRSPVMLDVGNAQNFELVADRPPPWATIHRNSVAAALLDCVDSTDWPAKAPFIVRR